MLGILQCDEETVEVDVSGVPTEKTKWLYDLGAGFDRNTLLVMVGKIDDVGDADVF